VFKYKRFYLGNLLAMAGGYGSNYIKGKFKWLLHFFYPPIPIQNIISKSKYREISNYIFNNSFKTLNVGSGDFIGVGAGLWKYSSGEVINLDIQEGFKVDIVGDAHHLPFKDKIFDSVIMQAVLEHLHTPDQALKEAFRVLKPNGFLYLEVPFLQGFHADPHDYYRYTQIGILKMTQNYGSILMKGVSSGPFSVINWIIRDLFSNLTPYKKLNLIIRFLISWLSFPLKYLDFLVKHTKASERLACENYYLIKKNNLSVIITDKSGLDDFSNE
jgi:ubiquinone/menaquinone biosynthesis C-methylase UbiE